MQEKEHVLQVLKDTISALEEEDVLALKELSNKTVHMSSIAQDPDNIIIAVIIYALSKIIERRKYKTYKDWPRFQAEYTSHIKNSITALENNKIKKFRKEMSSIRHDINKLSGNLKNYIKEVFRKAEINKASRIYEHGISMEKTSELLGITLWELAEYAGQTGIGDVNLSVTLPIKTRIKIAFDILEK